MENKQEMAKLFHGLHGKRAAISIAVMVIVTLLLFVYILFAMNVQSSTVSEDYDSIRQLNDIYSEQAGYENTLYFKLAGDFLNSYQRVLKDNSEKLGTESVSTLEGAFSADLETNFKRTDDGASDGFKKLFSQVNSFVFDGHRVYVSSPWNVKKDYSPMNVQYDSTLNISIGFENFGLPSFSEIEGSYLRCQESDQTEEDLKSCLEVEFSRFNVQFNRLNSGQVWLTSKDNYYVDNSLIPIAFTLSFSYAA